MDPLNVSTRDYKSSPRRLLSGMTSLGHLVATINQLWSCKAPKLEALKPTRRPKTTPSPICNVCAVATSIAFPELATRMSSSNGEANTAKSLIEVCRVLVKFIRTLLKVVRASVVPSRQDFMPRARLIDVLNRSVTVLSLTMLLPPAQRQ